MTWLVTGGARYIGAHVVRALVADGQEVVVKDGYFPLPSKIEQEELAKLLK